MIDLVRLARSPDHLFDARHGLHGVVADERAEFFLVEPTVQERHHHQQDEHDDFTLACPYKDDTEKQDTGHGPQGYPYEEAESGHEKVR